MRATVEDRGVLLRNRIFAERLVAESDPYEGGLHTPYPMTWALFHAAFLPLPVPAERALWCTAQILLLVAILRTLARAAARTAPAARARLPWIVALAAIASARFWLRDMAGGGSNLVVASLAFFGAMRILGARPFTGGPLLGAAAALKLTPLLFPPLLFACGRRLGGTLAVVTACAGLAAPALVLGPDRFLEIASDWAAGVLGFLGQDDLTGEQGAIIPFEWMNQSLRYAMFRYLTVIEPIPHPAYRHVGTLSPEVATWIFRATAAALVLGTVALLRAAAGRAASEQERSDEADGTPNARRSLRPMPPLLASAWCGQVFLVILMLSPISWRAHYVAAIPALFVASAHAIAGNRGRLGSRVVIAAFVLLAACTNETFWGKDGKMLLQAHYTVTIASLLLFAPLARVLLDPRAFAGEAQTPSPPDPPPAPGSISPERRREK